MSRYLRNGQRSRQLQTRHGSDRIVEHDSRMLQDFLELRRCLAVAPHPGINETTHVDRIERSEEASAGKVCGARNGEVVWCGGLRYFERFRWVILVECF